MRISQKWIALLAAVLCASMAGCGGQASEVLPESPTDAHNSASPTESTSAIPESGSSENSPEESTLNSADNTEAQKEATLYIGMAPDQFEMYPLSYSGELTPEALIQGISELTWWDLTLADTVSTGKGGMTVCFAETCSLFIGPPDPQNEKFHVFSTDQFSQTILDSIQKTLQMNFTGAGGNPDNLDIYYCAQDSRPLTLPLLGYTWSIEQPYHWENAVLQESSDGSLPEEIPTA